jgi:tetratricopeptide (TPR) repeat protein
MDPLRGHVAWPLDIENTARNQTLCFSLSLAFFEPADDKYKHLMMNRLLPLLLGVVLVIAPGVCAQAPARAVAPQTGIAQADYSQEAFVVEQMWNQVSFDNDGNRTRQQTTRVRVKTDAGVKEWGLLTIPFQSAAETLEVNYVRVVRADGSIIPTPPDNIQDLDSQITRDAPFYSDLREKHIAVKGLGKGDALEYQISWRPTKPLIPGQFWFEYNFQREGVVLDERVEIKVPATRAVKFKGPQATQTLKTEGDFRIYAWTFSRLQSIKELESDQKKVQAARGRSPAPDVQLSSFQTWADVGQWYWGLQKDRIEPSPAVRAKAAELTKGLTTDAAKLQALYAFVSMQYRYIGIAFGIGRYQPHAADDVLSNNYGDCKDKHTLLAALLQASGFTLYPALISSSHQLDPDVPSPAQFDHVIGYLPQGKGALWLDTTPEVSPYGYLVSVLRDKSALVMIGEKPAQLITTPSDPPFASSQTFKIEGKLADDGSFQAKVEDSSRGDGEIYLRAAFRRIPQPQWKDLVQQISYGLGYAGTVSDVNASAPELIAEPFHFSYSYNRKDYPDWTDHHFTVPGLPFFMPPARDDAKDPIWLGSFLDTVSDSKIELPKGYKPLLPSDVDLKYDFAEYHATYAQDQGTLTAKRRLLVKMHEVPVAELDDYRSFLKNLQNDIKRYVQTSFTTTTRTTTLIGGNLAAPPSTVVMPAFMSALQSLPESTSAEANRLENDARGEALQKDPSAAVGVLKKATEADPKFARAWVELATIYATQRQNDAALDALRTAIDAEPKQIAVRKLYAFILASLHRYETARQAWLDILKLSPDDPDANSSMAALLTIDKHYADAAPYLEALAKASPSANNQIRLGSVYLRAGQIEKGTATLRKVLETDSKPESLNDVAYEFAEANVNLPQALEYAKRAVEEQEKQSHDLRLATILQEDLICTQKIGSYWDTLGWVQFRLGHYEEAETYLQASWVLSQMAVVGDHLGQVYEKEKNTNQAIHMYRLALASPEGGGVNKDDTRTRLDHLGVKAPSNPLQAFGDRSGDELSKMRTVKLKKIATLGSVALTAEFFLLFSPDKLEEASFISGSEKLREVGDSIVDADFQVRLPPQSSARLVRRAIVMCSEVSGCQAVLYTPGTVHSLR